MARTKVPTVSERIILHLYYHHVSIDEYVVPEVITQHGIASAVGIERKHLRQYIKKYIEDGMIVEDKRHYIGGKQKRLAYFLSEEGMMYAKKLTSVYDLDTIAGKQSPVTEQPPKTHAAVKIIGRDNDIVSIGNVLNRRGIVCILGREGAGKTTLALSVIGGRPYVHIMIHPWDCTEDVLASMKKDLSVDSYSEVLNTIVNRRLWVVFDDIHNARNELRIFITTFLKDILKAITSGGLGIILTTEQLDPYLKSLLPQDSIFSIKGLGIHDAAKVLAIDMKLVKTIADHVGTYPGTLMLIKRMLDSGMDIEKALGNIAEYMLSTIEKDELRVLRILALNGGWIEEKILYSMVSIDKIEHLQNIGFVALENGWVRGCEKAILKAVMYHLPPSVQRDLRITLAEAYVNASRSPVETRVIIQYLTMAAYHWAHSGKHKEAFEILCTIDLNALGVRETHMLICILDAIKGHIPMEFMGDYILLKSEVEERIIRYGYKRNCFLISELLNRALINGYEAKGIDVLGQCCAPLSMGSDTKAAIDTAIARMAESISILEDVGDERGVAAIRLTEATLYLHNGKPEKAIDICQRIKTTDKEVHKRMLWITALAFLSTIKIDDAINTLHQLVTISGRSKEGLLALDVMGDIYALNSDYTLAVSMYGNALKYCKKEDVIYEPLEVKSNLCNVLIESNGAILNDSVLRRAKALCELLCNLCVNGGPMEVL